MIDPLAQVVTLLQPGAGFSKVVIGAGAWRVRRSETGQPFYCVILDGSCRLAAQGHEPLLLQQDDFVLIPAAYDFAMSSQMGSTHLNGGDIDTLPVAVGNGVFRVGNQEGRADVQLLVGHCVFGSPDAALLVSLLPRLVHVRGETRLKTLVKLVGEESREQRPAREVILARLLEVLLIEAFRSTAGPAASQGLLRGMGDPRLMTVIRQMHEDPIRSWTVAGMAKEAALSRSAFFERFSRAVGVAPMAYLLAWRMALAKNLLRSRKFGMTEVARRVGYSSASTFSVAFSRFVGQPPARYANSADNRETGTVTRRADSLL